LSNTAAQLKLHHYTYKFKKIIITLEQIPQNHRNDSNYIHVNKIAIKIRKKLNSKNVGRLHTQSKIKVQSQYSTLVLTVVRVMIAKYRK